MAGNFSTKREAVEAEKFWNWRRGAEFGGPFINELGLYEHGGFCSGHGTHPRRPGNTCSCYRSDLLYRKVGIELNRDAHTAKRTLFMSTCSGCGDRHEYPHVEEVIPRQTFCIKCRVWNKVEEVSWEGDDWSHLLPNIPRKRQ